MQLLAHRRATDTFHSQSPSIGPTRVPKPRSRFTPPTSRRSAEVAARARGRSDPGLGRRHNEDSYLIADLRSSSPVAEPQCWEHTVSGSGALFMVADGVGGTAHGDLASRMAIASVLGELRRQMCRTTDHNPASFVSALKTATETANSNIHAFACALPGYRGMGTTATVAGLFGDTLHVAQVGDSRAYVVRDGMSRQITKDQSLAQCLIDAGQLTADAAERCSERKVLLQALGRNDAIEVDMTRQTLERGDTVVLCTDGLWSLVRAEEFAAIVSEEQDLGVACERLIDLANERGGPDNITVLIVRFDGAQ